MTQKKIIKYSEAFKRRVVDEIASGKFPSISKVRRAYGITETTTIVHWIKNPCILDANTLIYQHLEQI